MSIITNFEAVISLVGGGVSENANGIHYHDGQIPPTESEIQAERIRMQIAYDAQAYARTRATAYPSIQDFMEAYTEKEIGSVSTKWDAYVTAYNKVRTDNPK